MTFCFKTIPFCGKAFGPHARASHWPSAFAWRIWRERLRHLSPIGFVMHEKVQLWHQSDVILSIINSWKVISLTIDGMIVDDLSVDYMIDDCIIVKIESRRGPYSSLDGYLLRTQQPLVPFSASGYPIYSWCCSRKVVPKLFQQTQSVLASSRPVLLQKHIQARMNTGDGMAINWHQGAE